MDLTNRIVIDLTAYGLTGEIVMVPPSPRREAWLKNQSMKHSKIDPHTGRPDIATSDIGDIEVLKIMSFIKSAPFPIDKLDGYYDYCDKIDEEQPGVSRKIHKALAEASVKLDMGETSPLE